jgi:hypothetical protein
MPKKRRDEHGLTDNDKHFVLEYLSNGRNGKEAWQTVHPGTTDSSAMAQASMCLRKLNVAKYITEIQEQEFKELGITNKKIMKEAATIGFVNIKTVSLSYAKKIAMIGHVKASFLDKLARMKKLYSDETPPDPDSETYEGPKLVLPVKGSYVISIQKTPAK